MEANKVSEIKWIELASLFILYNSSVNVHVIIVTEVLLFARRLLGGDSNVLV